MDLNDLLFCHQLSLMRAAACASQDDGQPHRGDASDYARRIASLRRASGAHVMMTLAA